MATVQDPFDVLAAETDPFAALADATDPTLGETIAESGKALVSGAMQFGGEALRGVGRAADTIREIAPWTTALDVGSGPSALTAAGEAVSGAAPEVDPRVAQSLPGMVASGIGQVGAMGATALLSPATALGGAVFGGVSDMDRRLAEADLSAGERAVYMLGGGGVAAMEMVPVAGLLARLNKVSGGATLAALRKAVAAGTLKASAVNVAETTALEGVTEQAQAELVNALVAHATDEDYQFLADWKEGAAGGGVGAIFATAVELATGKRRKLAAFAAERQIPWEQARQRYAEDAAFRAEVDYAGEDAALMAQAMADAAPVQDALAGMQVYTPEETQARMIEGEIARSAAWSSFLASLGPQERTNADAAPETPEDAVARSAAWQGFVSDVTAAPLEPGVPQRADIEAYRERFMEQTRRHPDAVRALREQVLFAEDAALREQFPGKEEWWYQGVADRRRRARDPSNPEGEKAAQELKRLRVRPLRVDTPVEMLDAVLRLVGTYAPGKSPSAEVAQGVATVTAYQPEYAQTPGKGSSLDYAIAPGAASQQARTPVQGQSGPQGQAVYPISGTSAVGAWGGTADNVIGAKAATRLEDIAASLVDAVEVLGVRTERIVDDTGSPIVGVYRPGGVIQTTPENVTEFAHEVGHAIHRVLMQGQRSGAAALQDWDSALTGLAPAVQGDLRKLGATQATGQPGRELTEGMGELVRMWVQTPEALTAQAPQAKAWFEGWLVSQDRRLQRSLVEAQQRAQTYRFQGDALRTRIAKPSTAWTRTLTRLRMLADNFARVVYDEAYAADAFDKRMDEMGKSGKLPLRDMIRSMRGIARGLTTNWLHGRPSDFYGRRVEGATNYDSIVKRLGRGEHEAMGDYLVARMTLAREATGYDTGMAPAEATRKIELYDREKPHFAQIADDLQKWWSGVNGVLAQYSPTYAAELARVQAADAALGIDFYIVMRRAMGEGRGRSSGQRSLVGSGAVSHRRTQGSARAVINPLESLANEARSRFERAVYRNALETMVSLHDAALEGGAEESGASPWIREIKPGDIGGVAYDPTTEEGFEALADVLNGPKLTGERVHVTVRDATGKLRTFSMDPKIASLAVTVDPLTLRQGLSWWGQMLSLARKGFVGGTVTYNPVFQFYTNILYDLPTAYLTGKYVRWYDLPGLVAQTAANIVQGTIHQATGRVVRSKWEDLYDALGLHATTSSQSEFTVGRSVRNAKGTRLQIEKLLDAAGVFFSVPQRATQITLMQKAAAARGIDINNLDAEGAMILRLAARQPVDYTAGSATSRRWQTAVPFLRAALEGQKQIGEAAKRNPIEFMAKLGILSAGAAAARWLFGDDELEASQSAEERLRTISIPLGDGPDAEVLQWRIPNELAPLIMGPSLLIDAMRGQGADPSELGKAALLAIAPPTILDNPLINTLMQQAMNKQRPAKSQFTENSGAPIVAAELEGKEPSAQQGAMTTPIAVKAAQAMDGALSYLPPTHPLRQTFGSPVRVEAALRSMLGGNVVSALEGYGYLPAPLRREREYEPGEQLSGMMRRGGMTSWDDPAIRAIYELDSQGDMAQRTRDGTSPEDPMVALRRQTISETAAVLSTMRWLSTHEAEGMTVQGRRALARAAQTLARQAVKELEAGGITTAYMGAADIRARRRLHDLNRGAFFR